MPDTERSLRKDAVSLVGGLCFAAVLACIAWWLWPSGITETPIAQLTLGKLGVAVASVAFWFWTVITIGTAFD